MEVQEQEFEPRVCAINSYATCLPRKKGAAGKGHGVNVSRLCLCERLSV